MGGCNSLSTLPSISIYNRGLTQAYNQGVQLHQVPQERKEKINDCYLSGKQNYRKRINCTMEQKTEEEVGGAGQSDKKKHGLTHMKFDSFG